MASLRDLPSIDTLMRSPELRGFPERIRAQASREVVSALRDRVRLGEAWNGVAPAELAREAATRLHQPSMRHAINASGVILHTGLGRARLATDVSKRVAEVAASHSTLELDLEEGSRGDRQVHVRSLLCALTGAESALVVNNNAAAVLLTLRALCANREVLLSRGQMVEIGGSFRMPDVVAESGCSLREVGCTNKTHLSDYARAFSDQTGAVLRCHPSNFKMTGFVSEPELTDLAKLAHENNALLIDDMGSGCLIDTREFGLPLEPMPQTSLRAGADIVTVSGDKLLGGPQAGIILGRAQLIDVIRKHPLARAVRIDKLGLAALEATLRMYVCDQVELLPTWQAISRPEGEVRRLARRIARSWPEQAVVQRGETEVGGGSLPGVTVPTWRVGLGSPDAGRLAKLLRTNTPAIIARIEEDTVWLDPRTVSNEEARELIRALEYVATLTFLPGPSDETK